MTTIETISWSKNSVKWTFLPLYVLLSRNIFLSRRLHWFLDFPVFLQLKIGQFYEISSHIFTHICSNALEKTFQYLTICMYVSWSFIVLIYETFSTYNNSRNFLWHYLHKQVFQHMKNSCNSWWKLGRSLKYKWWQ